MKLFRLIQAVILTFIFSCNNNNQTESKPVVDSPIVVDSTAPSLSTTDTSHTIHVQPDTSKEIYCDFIAGRWNVVGTSSKDGSTFSESVKFDCSYSRVTMKTPSLVSRLVRQGEAVGSMYSLSSKNVIGDKYSISLERDGVGMKGYLKQSFKSGSESYYCLKFRR